MARVTRKHALPVDITCSLGPGINALNCCVTQPHVYISEQYESLSLKCGGKEGKERKLVRVGKKGVVCVCVCVKGRQCKKGSVWGCIS